MLACNACTCCCSYWCCQAAHPPLQQHRKGIRTSISPEVTRFFWPPEMPRSMWLPYSQGSRTAMGELSNGGSRWLKGGSYRARRYGAHNSCCKPKWLVLIGERAAQSTGQAATASTCQPLAQGLEAPLTTSVSAQTSSPSVRSTRSVAMLCRPDLFSADR